MIGLLLQLAAPAHAADILLYQESARSSHAKAALDLLGYAYTTATSSNFTASVNGGTYELLVVDLPSTLPTGAWETAISNHISGGGMVVMGYWDYDTSATLQAAFDCTVTTSLSTPGPIYQWDSTHPIYSTPYAIPSITTRADVGWADDGDELRATGSATLPGGYSSAVSTTRGAICESNSGATIYNGFLFDDYSGDQDADGTRDMVELVANEIYYVLYGGCDEDGDSYESTAAGCAGDDCDDTNAGINPSVAEIPYDGIDQDCSGADLTDVDEDGYDADVVGGPDCDDTDDTVKPGETESADGVDEDCDGTVDETTVKYDDDGDGWTDEGGDCNDAVSGVNPGATETCDGVDQDCDGVTDEETSCGDDDADGYTEDAGDCHDGAPAINPGMVEILGNGIDDDCDGMVDDGDGDSDGDGVSPVGGDCNDADGAVYPGNPELQDGLDNDCDGVTDEGTANFDDDGDGVSEVEGDCNDTDAFVYPGASEHENGYDDDCDGSVDEGGDYTDDDGDGVAEAGGDCDDDDPLTAPGAIEQANGADDDCDGLVDEGTDAYDQDGDGFSVTDGDCDDGEPWVNPGQVELCNAVDDNCDAVIDEECAEDTGNTDSGKADPGDDCGCGSSGALPGVFLLLAGVVATRRREE